MNRLTDLSEIFGKGWYHHADQFYPARFYNNPSVFELFAQNLLFYPYVLFLAMTAMIFTDIKHNFYKGYPKEQLRKIWFKSMKWFQRRCLKKITDY